MSVTINLGKPWTLLQKKKKTLESDSSLPLLHSDLAAGYEQTCIYQLIQNEDVYCNWSGPHDVWSLSKFL